MYLFFGLIQRTKNQDWTRRTVTPLRHAGKRENSLSLRQSLFLFRVPLLRFCRPAGSGRLSFSLSTTSPVCVITGIQRTLLCRITRLALPIYDLRFTISDFPLCHPDRSGGISSGKAVLNVPAHPPLLPWPPAPRKPARGRSGRRRTSRRSLRGCRGRRPTRSSAVPSGR